MVRPSRASRSSERPNNSPHLQLDRIEWYAHRGDRGCARANARTISESNDDTIVQERCAGSGPSGYPLGGLTHQVLDGDQLGEAVTSRNDFYERPHGDGPPDVFLG